VKSLLQINDLTLSDRPEVKLIKHIFKNDDSISKMLKQAFNTQSIFRRTIVVKITSEIEDQRATKSLILASALFLGAKVALGTLKTDDSDPQFEDEARNLGQIGIYADYLEQ
jgi:hypothetical protein